MHDSRLNDSDLLTSDRPETNFLSVRLIRGMNRVMCLQQLGHPATPVVLNHYQIANELCQMVKPNQKCESRRVCGGE